MIDTAMSDDELNQKEIFWIQTLDAVNNGYNQTSGGEGGNTYKYKTEEEMNCIKEKIRKSKILKNNPHARAVKCKNVKTNQELFFDTVIECIDYFQEKNKNFIISRCQHKTKFVYKSELIFAYIEDDYIQDYTFEKSIHRKKLIKIIKISENKEYIFSSYKNAEQFFNLPNKFFSGKAYLHKDEEYWEKSDFRIFVLE